MELGSTDDNLVITEVPDKESAQRLGFQDSPSILVNRKDIYTGQEPTGFSYACRIYEFYGKQTGVIPKGVYQGEIGGILIKWGHRIMKHPVVVSRVDLINL